MGGGVRARACTTGFQSVNIDLTGPHCLVKYMEDGLGLGLGFLGLPPPRLLVLHRLGQGRSLTALEVLLLDHQVMVRGI